MLGTYLLSRRFKLGIGLTIAFVVIAGTLALVIWPKQSGPLIQLAGVVVNFAAVMAAVILGWGGFRAASQQAEDGRRATVLAYRPLLVPVHESAGPPSENGSRQFFPALEGVMIEPSDSATRTFRVTQRLDLDRKTNDQIPQAWLHLRNVGQGPAIIDDVTVWNFSGRRGELAGLGSVGAGSCELFTGDLDGSIPSEQVARTQRANGLHSRWIKKEPDRVYWLEVTYSDVFGSLPVRRLQAWFDPEGRGQWRVLSDLADPRT
jgi:hypothetical protein